MKTIREKLMQLENSVFSNREKTYSDYSEYTLICISEYGKLSYSNNIPFSTCLAQRRWIREKSKTLTFIVFTKDWEKLEKTIHF